MRSPIRSKPELIADYGCDTAEGPLWHPLHHRLYWTDIPTGRLFRYDPITCQHEQCYTGRPVGGFTVQADGSLLLFMDRGTIAVWNEGAVQIIVPELEAELETRFNDVIADPVGRVFCGTLFGPRGKGRLYRLDTDGSLHLLLENVGCANGMAFSRDGKTLFFTDSFAYCIYAFDYAVTDGSLTNRRVFAKVPESTGFPDGCTVDAEGNLWSAIWGASVLARFDANGSIATTVAVPMRKVTSLTICEDGWTYITSEGGRPKPKDDPLAGALMRLQLGVAGIPEHLSRIALPPSL